jgi:hypothetical protein
MPGLFEERETSLHDMYYHECWTFMAGSCERVREIIA